MTEQDGALSTHEPALLEDSHVRKRKLAVFSSPALARHPRDAFVFADGYPLGRGSRRALRAMALAMIPPAPAPEIPDLLERTEKFVRGFMAYMHPWAARAFVLTLLILDLSPLFLFQSWRRMRTLETEKLSRLLERMVDGRFAFMRTLVVAVRGLLMSAYFDQDEVHRAIGYAPLPFMRERAERRMQISRPAHAALAGGRR